MKIAHINPGHRGLASYVLNIYNYFDTHDKSVDNLVVSAVKWTKHPIPVFEPKSRLVGQIYPLVYHPKEVENKLLEYKPDILHYHHPSGNLDFYIDRFRRAIECPSCKYVHMSIGSKRYFVDWVMHENFMLPHNNFNRDKNMCCYVAISKFVQKQTEKIGGLRLTELSCFMPVLILNIYKPIEYYQA